MTALPPVAISDVDRILDALGDPTRRAIVARLGAGPRSVSHLARPLGITITAVSQHVRVLERCGLLTTQKTGRVRTCQMERGGLDALDAWVRQCRSLWERRLDRLGDLLDADEL
jgi:DNA-binding transcriptional ArsR family regulator